MPLTTRAFFVILSKRLTKGALCDEAGDCSEIEVTSVEYVRRRPMCCRGIGRLRLFRTSVYRLREKPAKVGNGMKMPVPVPVCFSGRV